MRRSFGVTVAILALTGCGTHRSYDTASFRERGTAIERVTVGKNGLSKDQIAAISATRPPDGQPVDVALIFLHDGRAEQTLEDAFSFAVVDGLKKSGRFRRITPLPPFIVPATPSFDAIQELGLRSLSDYVLVFNIDSADLFRWTVLVQSEWELQSAISFILVDSSSSAMLTADKLFSTERYRQRIDKVDEMGKAQRKLLGEQAELLVQKLGGLFAAK